MRQKKSQNSLQYIKVMDFMSSDSWVWEIGPVREGNNKNIFIYLTNQAFIRTLIEKLEYLITRCPHIVDEAENCIVALSDTGTYTSLLKPMKPGPRGDNGCVEIKKDKRTFGPNCVIPRRD